MAGEPIPVFNHGNMKRDFTFIDDIISGTRSAIDKNYKCEIFNLGNSSSEKLLDVIKFIEKELNAKAIINYQPMQPGDAKESFADIEYSKNKLGFTPETSIDIGISKFINWYKTYVK